MASIRKRNDKWEVQIRRKGFSTICKSFHMKADAQEWARYMEQKADRRSLPYDPKKLDAITLKALLERYKAEIIPRKRGEAEPIILDVFMRREAKLCAMPLSCITVSHFCSYRDKRIKTAKAATVCRELGLTPSSVVLSIPMRMRSNGPGLPNCKPIDATCLLLPRLSINLRLGPSLSVTGMKSALKSGAMFLSSISLIHSCGRGLPITRWPKSPHLIFVPIGTSG